MLEAIIRAADEIFPEAIFAVHLDHGDEPPAYDCIECGFYSSVMIDASHEPFDENIRITKRVVDAAHARGHRRRGRTRQLGGVEEHVQVDEKNAHLTDPAEAEEFVERVGLRLPGRAPSAPATAPTSSAATRRCTSTCWRRSRSGCPASRWSCTARRSVPQEEVERINAAGGEIKGARGVDENEFAKAVPSWA